MEGLGGEWDIKFDHDSIHTSAAQLSLSFKVLNMLLPSDYFRSGLEGEGFEGVIKKKNMRSDFGSNGGLGDV